MVHSRIAGVGGYLPARIVTNDELAARLDTSDEWIAARTGIRQRHIASPEETATYMAAEASREALAQAGIEGDAVDLIVLATATPDEAFPATAVRVQAALGARGFAMDVSAACGGFLFALATADNAIRLGQSKRALVIGSEVYSRILDWDDRATCVLFGDGAGALLLEAGAAPGEGVLSTHLHSDGKLAHLLYVDGAVGQPGRSQHLRMNGREVFRHAVIKLAAVVDEALDANGLTHADIDWLIPHQANLRIIDGMGKRLGLPPDRVVVTVDRHANTSAASVPLAMREAWRDGRLQRGHLAALEALGGGLTWGAALVRL